MEDRESWLAAILEKEPNGADETAGLYAAAALVRGALNAPEVPESVQSQSRANALATLEELFEQTTPEPPPRSWLSHLGSWLQVASNLFRKR